MRVSVVIPALNEAAGIASAIDSAAGAGEVIVADGGSHDATAAIAERLGARLVRSERGRALQQNAGAAVATGDVLLFLHADTRLPTGWPAAVERALRRPKVVAGAFRLGFDDGAFVFRVIEWGGWLRTRLTGIPYGDQAIFVRRAAFERAGGFPALPLMEDVALGRRLKRLGRLVLLPERVETSARRFRTEGPLRAVLRNWRLIALYHLGRDPEALRRHYPDHVPG